MAPGRIFDCTTRPLAQSTMCCADFYYHEETLIRLAAKHALRARLMEDWERGTHPRSELGVTGADADASIVTSIPVPI